MTQEKEKESKPRFCRLVGNIASALNAKTHPLLLLCAHNKARKGDRISLNLLSFKLNTSFNLKKRREGKGAKKCAYPRKVGGGKTEKEEGGCTHCQQQFFSPLQRGLVPTQWPAAKEERGQVCSCSLFSSPQPLHTSPLHSSSASTRGWLSQFLSLLLAALALEQQRKVGEEGRPFPSSSVHSSSLFTRVPVAESQKMLAARLCVQPVCVRISSSST